ncbi:MAG TPA: transposase [Nitrospirota bacterium]|nr:transposase [Nitrospirota bacterium]
MALSSGVKFRCYPDSYQARVLSAWIGCQRFIYNAKVSEERYFRKHQEKALCLAGVPVPVDQQYSQFKDRALTPFLFEVPSPILRNGATRFMGAYQRFRAGLASRPAFKKSYGRQSVWITGELFRFKPTGKTSRRQEKTIYDHALYIGTKKHNLGALKFKAHTEYGLPSTITVSRENGTWYVSFSYDKAGALMDQAELMNLYRGMSKEDLDQITIGLDRGVCLPAAASSGDVYDFKAVEQGRLARKERRQRRHQRQAARRKKGSGRRERSLREKTRCGAYAANVRRDFAHQASRKIADSPAEVIVFEDLKVRNMTARPKPQKDGSGA